MYTQEYSPVKSDNKQRIKVIKKTTIYGKRKIKV